MKNVLRLPPFLLVSCLAACAAAPDDEPTPEPEWQPPPFVHDCLEGSTDEQGDATWLDATETHRIEDVELCEDDLDWYRLDVPAHAWVSVEVLIDGDGTWDGDGTDFDLLELDADGDELWASAHEQPFERLAWVNTTDEPVTRWLLVDGYNGSTGSYDLDVQTLPWTDDLECDDLFSELDRSDESGPCNRIIQFPQGQDGDGYHVSHLPHYSNLRREIVHLVRYAAAKTLAQYPGTPSLALMDMTEQDGDTPGRMVGSLRHPEGTHANGNDLDIAYYQNGDDNEGRAICDNDNYFCTGDPYLLDAERTAYFLAAIFEHPEVRVVGVDTATVYPLRTAADDLRARGLIGSAEHLRFDSKLAYGDGWPFHHHHMHFSWNWETGYERDFVEGCGVAGVRYLAGE